ncbi:hypothetical protein NECAME_13154 [Necator americanus]|uniref:PPM-type phosphatase domain-containing protein n=1 Tax=Necator americanus TaxID=51031 RepID=W2SWN6_NECAM|nr:hypothetical protein NECAME_13154 [Necator americanus]ETN74174.1 hypothetical protein NECAME_13154 [Necator americanus]
MQKGANFKQSIYNKKQKQQGTESSTMIAAILEDNRYLSVINVGDSRAVACDTCDQMISLSKDHKPDDVSQCQLGLS